MITRRSRLCEFSRHSQGNVSVMFGLSLVPLLLISGVAIDMNSVNSVTAMAQAAVDSASLAGAATVGGVTDKEMTLKGDDAKVYVAKKMVEVNLPAKLKKLAASPRVVVKDGKITVDMTVPMATSFLRLARINSVNIHVTSTAQVASNGRTCIMALGENGAGVSVGGTPIIDAPDCWVYSNKTGAGSISIQGSATVTTAGMCAVGQASVADTAQVTPKPRTACRPIKDPLADWQPPATTWACNYTNFDKKATGQNKAITLSPGVYCGGLQVNLYDTVTLNPGIYFIKDGAFKINAKVKLTGDNVGFFLGKNVTSVTIDGAAAVDLTADKSNAMAGLIIAGQAGAPIISAKITGSSSLYIKGTVYLPNSKIELAGTSSTVLSPVSQFIGYSVTLQGTSNLRFKSDFATAGFKAIGPVSTEVLLIN